MGGVFFCTVCGSFAKIKLVKLDDPCMLVRHSANFNLKAYKFGRAPAGFPDWPYKHVTMCRTTVLGTVRASVERLAAAQRDQPQVVSSDEEWLDSNESGPSLSILGPSGSSSSQS